MLIFLIIVGPYFEVIVVKFLSAAGLTPVFGEVDSKSDKLSMKSAGSLHNIIEFLVAGHSGVFALESKRTTRMNKGTAWSIQDSQKEAWRPSDIFTTAVNFEDHLFLKTGYKTTVDGSMAMVHHRNQPFGKAYNNPLTLSLSFSLRFSHTQTYTQRLWIMTELSAEDDLSFKSIIKTTKKKRTPEKH